MKRVAGSLIVGYQKLGRPFLGAHCRFYPSCSDYMLETIRRYGVIRGSALGLWRLAHCHPFSAGGFDRA